MKRLWLAAILGALLLGLPGHAVAQTAAQSSPPEKAVTLDTDPHLIAWWKFDEATGKSAADASKHTHDGVLEGGAAFDAASAPGRIGTAIKLDGKEAYVRVPGYKGVAGTGPRTLAAWIKTPTGAGEIMSWGFDDHGKMWIFGHVRGRVGVTPKGGYLYIKAGTADDAWHHVAVVVREASPPNLHDDVKLYRDGEVAEIDDIGLLDLWPIETGDTLEVRIGRRFKGFLDDLRLYDRALSENEIKALFQLQSDRPLTKP